MPPPPFPSNVCARSLGTTLCLQFSPQHLAYSAMWLSNELFKVRCRMNS
jgi:hypothetical protein